MQKIKHMTLTLGVSPPQYKFPSLILIKNVTNIKYKWGKTEDT